MADEFKIVASLNIPESASRINKDIPKLETFTTGDHSFNETTKLILSSMF